jgi:DHA1 family bicyclomycin/chloramphenicol resistance-like MFS transporter
VAGRLSRRVAAPALVRGGTLVALAGGVVMVALAAAGFQRAWAVLGPVMLLTAGFGTVLPAATAAALDRHPQQAGLASALLGFIQIGAAAGGTALAGAVLGRSTLPVACVFLGLTAGAALCGARRPA